jgi:hypothetical protein
MSGNGVINNGENININNNGSISIINENINNGVINGVMA